MVRKLVTPGRVLTPAEKMRRYREKPKNKAKIKEYEQSERRVNSKKLRDMTIRKEREKVVFRGQKRRPPSTEVEDSDQDEAKDDEEGGGQRKGVMQMSWRRNPGLTQLKMIWKNNRFLTCPYLRRQKKMVQTQRMMIQQVRMN